MKPLVWTGACAVLIASASMTQAQDLDTKSQRSLERALKTAEKLETDLQRYEGEGERPYNDGVGERASSKVERAAEKLAELPQDHPRVAAIAERLDALRTRLARLVEEKGSMGARSGLEDKQATKLNSAATLLENLETSLGHHGPDGKYAFNDRNRERFEGKLADVTKRLAELPADNRMVALLRAHLAQVRAQLEGMGGNLEEAKAKAAELAAARQALLSAPEFASDLQEGRALVVLFKSWSLFQFDSPFLRRNYRTPTLVEAEECAARWPASQQAYARLAEKYAPLRGGRAVDMLILLMDGDRFCAKFAENAKAFVGGAPARVDTLSAEALQHAKAAVADKRHAEFIDSRSSLNRALAQVKHIASLVNTLSEGATDLTPKAKAVEADVAKAMDALAADIVASNRAPSDVYAGADKAALEAFARETWAKHFASETVLAVRFPDDAFRRTVAWRWDKQRKEYYQVDHSELWISVVVESGDGEAILYRSVIRKMHLEGDRLTFAWERPERVPPTQRMHAKNL